MASLFLPSLIFVRAQKMASVPIGGSGSENLIHKDHKQIGNNHSLRRIGWMAKVISIYVSLHPKKTQVLCMQKRYLYRHKGGAQGGKLEGFMFPVEIWSVM